MADLGEDFSGITDLMPDLSLSTGRKAFLEAMGCRLTQQRGGLFYDQSYGYDVRGLLSAGVRPRVAEQAIETQAFADERTENAEATVEFNEATREVSVRLDVETADGPFSLTVDPKDLTFELLDQE